jgi:hypothetical protein
VVEFTHLWPGCWNHASCAKLSKRKAVQKFTSIEAPPCAGAFSSGNWDLTLFLLQALYYLLAFHSLVISLFGFSGGDLDLGTLHFCLITS